MFREIKRVRQDNPPGQRRWFEGDRLELVTWYSAAGALTGFQLLYESDTTRRALTWRFGVGFSHSRVDEGDSSPFKNSTPVLIQEREVPWSDLRAAFREEAATLELSVRDAVLAEMGRVA